MYILVNEGNDELVGMYYYYRNLYYVAGVGGQLFLRSPYFALLISQSPTVLRTSGDFKKLY